MTQRKFYSDVNVDGNVQLKSLTFKQNVTISTPALSETFWDTNKEALVTQNSNNKQLIHGEELWVPLCLNESGAEILNGQPVYIASSSGGYPTIELANNHTYVASRMIGVVTENIPNGQTGRVTRFGYVNNIDLTMFNDGDLAYLGDNELTNTIPTNSDFPVTVGKVINASTTGKLLVYPQTAHQTGEMTLENGFGSYLEGDDSTINVDNTTRTFTITPVNTAFHYYNRGIKFIKESSDSIVFPDVEGFHVFYYVNETLNLMTNPTTEEVYNIYLNYVPISTVYWDTTNQIHLNISNSRHTIQWPSSILAHDWLVFGVNYISGLALIDFTIGNGNSNSDAQFGVDSGTVVNQDIFINLSTIPTTTGLPIMYRDGSEGNWRREYNAGYSILNDSGTGRMQYNYFDGSVWSLVPITSTYYAFMHIYAVNNNENERLYSLIGLNEYKNVADAESNIGNEIIEYSKVISKRFVGIKHIGSVLFQTKDNFTNDVKTRVVQTLEDDNYYDYREALVASGGGGITSTSFIGLEDTPTSFDTHADSLVRVNSTATGLVFSALNTIELTEFNNNLTLANIPDSSSRKAITTSAQTITGQKTFNSDIIIPDEVYGIDWDGKLEAPTKNALYDKLSSLTSTDINDFQSAVSSNSDVTDAYDHITSTGESHSYINQDVTSTSSPSFNHPNVNNLTLSGETKTLNLLFDYWDNMAAAGRMYGGVITSNGDGTVNIEAGGGIIKTDDVTDPQQVPLSINEGQGSKVIEISWDEISSLSLIDNAYNYIFYDGSSNSIKTTTNFYSISFTRDFTIGRAYRRGTDVLVRLCGTNSWNFNRRLQLFGEEVFPIKRANGLIIGNPSGLYISVSSGILWAELINRFVVTSTDTSTGGTFSYWYRDGSGGFVEVTGQTEIDNEYYDDGTGTLALSTNNYYVNHWVYVSHDSSVHVVYGQAEFNQIGDARSEPVPSDIPGLVRAYSSFIGRVIVEHDATTLSSVNTAFETDFQISPTIEHNDTSNKQGGVVGEYYHLTADQHNEIINFTEGTFTDITITNSATDINPLIVDGIVDTTANLQEWQSNGTTLSVIDSSGYLGIGVNPTESIETSDNIKGVQFISTASGTTAPLVINSTALVTNLNSDLLDEEHGSYYLNYDNFTNTPTIGDGTLSASGNTTGSTGVTVDLNFSGTYSANTTDDITVNPVVGPALSNLASYMTGTNNIGFIKKTAQDTYTVDTNTYLMTSNLLEGTGISLSVNDNDVQITNTDLGSSQNIFKNIADAAGIIEFSSDTNDDILRFAASGEATVSFLAADKTINYYSPPHPTQSAIDTTELSDGTVISRIEVNTSGHTTNVNTRVLTLGDLGYTGDTDANNYVHPSGFTNQPENALTGANVISQVNVNTYGHVTGTTTRDLTLGDLGYTGATDADNYDSWIYESQDDTGTPINSTSIESGQTAAIKEGTNISLSHSGNVITINSNYVNTTYSAGTGLSLSGTTFNHSNSITSGTVSEGGSERTLNFGGTFNVPSVSYDSEGHITSKGSVTLTMPDNPDTNWYPTGYTWTNDTTSGPTGTLSGVGMSSVTFPSIPTATGTRSGVVTTTTQTFAGDKTFSDITTISDTTESSGTGSGALVVTGGAGIGKNLNIGGNLNVSGNLVVDGTTTTVNSNTVTIDDPIFTLGGDTAPTVDDNKDRGVEFRWHNGSTDKLGFFGFDDSTGKFTFIPDGTNTSEVFSGTKGEIDANIDWSNLLNLPDPSITIELDGDVTGTVTETLTNLNGATFTINTTVAENSVALGTDTTGNYVSLVDSGTGISVSGSAGEGATFTVSHADTSTLSGTQGSGGIASISVDGMGHVTGVTTANYLTSQSNDFGIIAIDDDSGYTWDVPNTNNDQVADTTGDTFTLVKGVGINLFTSTTSTDAIKVSHANTSDLSGTQGGDGIASISVDEMGHVTDVTTANYLTGTKVDSISTADTGLLANGVTGSTTGAVTLSGVLNVANGGTGESSFTNGQLLIGNSTGNTLNKATLTQNTGISITNGNGSISIGHGDTSSASNLSVNNSGNTVIQDISLDFDQFGHVTGTTSSSTTISLSKTDDTGDYLTDITVSGLNVTEVKGTFKLASQNNGGALKFNGDTQLTGALYGGTTNPTGSTRLNYGGYLYPTQLNLASTSNTSSTATHYFVETGSDGFVRPKTLSNVRAEVVTTGTLSDTTSNNVTGTGHTHAITTYTPSGSSAMSVSGGKVLGSTLTIGLATNYGDVQNPYGSKTAKHFLAAPNTSSGSPSFRAIVASDIPTLNQDTTGNAETSNLADEAIKLQTERTITLTGAVTGSAAFDGSTNITINTTSDYLESVSFSDIQSGSVILSTESFSDVDDQLMTAAAINDLIEANSSSNVSISKSDTAPSATSETMWFQPTTGDLAISVDDQWVKVNKNLNVDYYTESEIDTMLTNYSVNPNFGTTNIDGDLHVTGEAQLNAQTASKLLNERTITVSGDTSGSVLFDGSSDVTLSIAVNDNSHNHTNSTITLASTDLTDSSDLIRTSDVDDTPVSGATTAPISSNWAYEHLNATNPHGITLSGLGFTGDTNANYYTHPDYSETDLNTSTAQVIDTITIINGHIDGITTRNLTPSNIGAMSTSHPANNITSTHLYMGNGDGFIWDDTNNIMYVRADSIDFELYHQGHKPTPTEIGAQPAGTYNTTIGTDVDIDTTGATIIDSLTMTDGVITAHETRVLTTTDIGAEPAFSKNSAFNKNFGTSSGTVTQGNDSRLSNERTPIDNSVTYAKIDDTLKNRITDNGATWDFDNGIIDSSVDSNTTVSFSNVRQNKTLKVKVVITNSSTITLPSECIILDGSAEMSGNNGNYYVYFDAWSSTEILVSIAKAAT